MFSLKRLRGGFIHLQNYQKGSCGKEGVLFSQMKSLKLQQSRFRGDIRKHFFTVVRHWKKLPREAVKSLKLDLALRNMV